MSRPVLDEALTTALAKLAARPRILVASDYDGCVSPIVSRPEDAVPNPRSMAALEACARTADTVAALVSGRARSDLQSLSGASDRLTLVGSHGSEFAEGFDTAVGDAERELLARIIAEFETISARFPGTSVEMKPISTTLHVRNASDDDAAAALRLAESGPASWDGVYVTHGKAVVELAVIETSKGHALDRLRDALAVDAIVYLGDDVTDEKAFAHLRDGDVGVKVGAGDTAAQYRVADPDGVAAVLETLVSLRG
ncbi:trehalose-phosphatase [Gordonia sp. (in: high G+C Gram-positive bacteria)]|uniref:trehalose-phosphatase n=1 Tax=Gordonia sp. (in: high G+C Gram-positive bacteria) TaxID=84139 RepID=UPI0016906963|nr:trehalose-phosphatase [Gordonia sp. (in: high G+C Gram-positive bacteria)]NLG44999.1 trehalose-phosphatase [Gordonia sp. (in: high G+C Gram-positive bacteria)]